MTPKLYYRLLGPAFAILLVANVFAQAPAGRPSPPAAPAATTPARPSGPWWFSDDFKKEVGLTNDQSARLEHIFQDALTRLREDYAQLDEREDKLSRLIEDSADEPVIASQIDRVEAKRSAMNKERELMLVHMRAVLTPGQRVKFNEHWLHMRQQQQQPRGGQGSQQRTPAPGSGTSHGTQAPSPGATPAPGN